MSPLTEQCWLREVGDCWTNERPSLQLSQGGQFTDEERQKHCPGLVDYSPSGFVEVGSFDEQQKLFRFSPLHNDVIPAISDMIRWSLKLPNRFADRGPIPAGGNGMRELDPEAPGNLFHTRVESPVGSIPVSTWKEVIHAAVRIGSEDGLSAQELGHLARAQDHDPGVGSFVRVDGTSIWLPGMDANQCWQRSYHLAQRVGINIKLVVEWEETEGAAHPGERAALRWSPAP